MKEAKKEIKEFVAEFDGDFFERNFKELEFFFRDTVKWFKTNNYFGHRPIEEYFSFKLEHDYESDYGGDRYTRYKVYGFRLETDEEYNNRLEANKKAKLAAQKAAKTREENKKIAEKAEFERLKKLYGK